MIFDVTLTLYSIKVCNLLDVQKVLWTSIDVVRFRMGKDLADLGPVVLWIGVLPDTLTGEDGYHSANGLLELLQRHSIIDIDIEYRESVYRRSAGPPLLKSVSSVNSTVDVVGPLTAALGLPIAALATPYLEGTIGFYLAEGGGSKNILAVTARHALFPLNEDNTDYTRKDNSMRRKDVLLMGTEAFKDLLTSIMVRIGNHATMVGIYKAQISRLEEMLAGNDETDVKEARKDLKKTTRLLEEAEEAIDELRVLHDKTKKEWSKPRQRIIGHVVSSPAIDVGTGPHRFTMDYAVIKLDEEKFRESFKGNTMDLGEFRYILQKPPNLTVLSRDGYSG
jgi:hypothetical protein